MMKDNYYVPSIEEFFVGFDYDWHDHHFGWKPHKMDMEDLQSYQSFSEMNAKSEKDE